jgi:two-component system sensor histidine kinase UhpB
VSGLHVERQFDPALPKLLPDVELALYRIAQEGLTNVARHADATRVTISLERGHQSVVLSVVDDGRGFSGQPQEHGGLRSMRERASLIDGALAVRSGRGGGVEIRLEVPTPAMMQTAGVEG